MSPLLLAILTLPIGMLLGLLGGGGSILTVPLFVLALRYSEQRAVAASLLVVGVTSAVAAVPYLRRGQVQFKSAWPFALAALAFSAVGSVVSHYLPGPLLMVMFALLMLVTAVAMWTRHEAVASTSEATRPVAMLGAGTGVGFLTGLVGAGGGFLVVPALTVLGKLETRIAIGTSLLVIAMNSAAGVAGHWQHLRGALPQTLFVALVAVVGSLVGASLAPHISVQRLRKSFALFVFGVGGWLLFSQYSAWLLRP